MRNTCSSEQNVPARSRVLKAGLRGDVLIMRRRRGGDCCTQGDIWTALAERRRDIKQESNYSQRCIFRLCVVKSGTPLCRRREYSFVGMKNKMCFVGVA